MTDFKIDFCIVGQPKSGTTALAQFLGDHPQICMSTPKEPGYFATDHIRESDEYYGKRLYYEIRTLEQYKSLFNNGGTDSLLRGEASTSYLYSKEAAKNLHEHNPEMKIIIMLRNPVDMIHSLHMQYVLHTMEQEKNFEKALELESSRKSGQNLAKNVRCPSLLFYRERVKYDEQITRFFDLFHKDQFQILIMEEFLKDNVAQTRDVYRFLEVDEQFKPDVKEVNASKAIKSPMLNNALNNPALKNFTRNILGVENYTKLQNRANGLLTSNKKREPLDPELRAKLTAEFRPMVAATSSLIGVDLSQYWS